MYWAGRRFFASSLSCSAIVCSEKIPISLPHTRMKTAELTFGKSSFMWEPSITHNGNERVISYCLLKPPSSPVTCNCSRISIYFPILLVTTSVYTCPIKRVLAYKWFIRVGCCYFLHLLHHFSLSLSLVWISGHEAVQV